MSCPSENLKFVPWYNSMSLGNTAVVGDVGTSGEMVPVTVPYIRSM
jgi:hypothetical protein